MKKMRLIISTLFALLFLIIGIFALSNYGANWDESIHFGRGQAILHFTLTGEKDYESFEKNPPTRRSYIKVIAINIAILKKTLELPLTSSLEQVTLFFPIFLRLLSIVSSMDG